MKKRMKKKDVQILLFILIAFVSLSISYAAITSIILTINGTASAEADDINFKVHFDRSVSPTMTVNKGSAEIDEYDDKIAHFNVNNLEGTGDSATAEYTVINESNGIGAHINLDLTNTNTEYFRVTETIDDTELQAGDTTKVRIVVELIKEPTNHEETTEIIGTLTARAVQNGSANSSVSDTVTGHKPNYFATDSWSTIQTNIRNNNIDRYNIGDTKTVSIDGNDYTVRVSNKSTSSNCSNANYSQTACGFVVEFTGAVANSPMYGNSIETASNNIGYQSTLVYSYLENTLYNKLPEDLQNVISNTRLIENYVDQLDVRLYILSAKEVFNYDQSSENDLSTQLDYYREKNVFVPNDNPNTVNNNRFVVKTTPNGNRVYWWLRSPYKDDNQSFQEVTDGGFLYKMQSHYNDYVSPAFRIS